MTDDGFYLGLEEGAALGVVVQRLQFGHERRTALHPAVEGLHGGFGGAVRMVEQSQLGLAVGTWCEHDYDDL